MNKRRYKAVAVITFIFMVAALFTVPIFGNAEVSVAIESSTCLSRVDFGSKMPQNNARCAIVIDAKTGNILFSKNADEARGMASTTKIMTALVAIENCIPETEFAIPKEAVGIEGSSVYLTENESLTMRELLYCLMLESGNDAATAIAVCCGGSIDGFVDMMNARAEELGLENTNFTNPHGLSDDMHRTTAKELALITAEAMKYPLFREIVSTKTAKVRYNGAENGRSLVNHNKLLFSYDGATGVKTGYTKKDGRCLVSSAERNGMEIIAVTLDDPSPTSTHKVLLDAAFEAFEQRHIASSGDITAELPIINGEDDFLTVSNTQTLYICLPKGSAIEAELILPDVLCAPVESGRIIGKAVIRSSGKEVYIINIESIESIKEKKKSLLEKLFGD